MPQQTTHYRRSWVGLALISTALVWASATGRAGLSLTEVLGFVTGAACVLLVIGENVWNFPVGIANNVFFLVLFWSSRLYADMALQVLYIALGLTGWWQWLHGGVGAEALKITRCPARERLLLGLVGLAAFAMLRAHLVRIGDAAPAQDALTTVMSIIAQWLLNKKRIENWWVWVAADVLYVALYVQRGLYLTAVLYALFILMCLAGLARWRAAVSEPAAALRTPPLAAA